VGHDSRRRAAGPPSSDVARNLLAGSAGGVVGTVAMSGVMLAGGYAGLMGTQPPRVVVDKTASETGVGDTADDSTRDAAATLVHLLIGCAAGAAFALGRTAANRITGRSMPVVPSGAAFGLVLWALNYMALAPALGLLPPATDDRPPRPPIMIAAHLVFGVTTGLAMAFVRRRIRLADDVAGAA
jgi:hypothetical protein